MTQYVVAPRASIDLLGNDVTDQVIGAAIDIHRELGPGLLESVYQCCMAEELTLRSIPFEQQRLIPIRYKGRELDATLRADFVVAKCVILEIKSVEALHPIHTAQLLTYLRLTRLRVGLLINFNVNLLRDGIVRRVL